MNVASIWSALREMDSPFFSNASDLWCVSLRPTAKHVMPEQDWLIDWRGARRWLAAPCDRESLDEHFEEEGVEAWQVRGAARVGPGRSAGACASRRATVASVRGSSANGQVVGGKLCCSLFLFIILTD